MVSGHPVERPVAAFSVVFPVNLVADHPDDFKLRIPWLLRCCFAIGIPFVVMVVVGLGGAG